jgi:glycosyltransferase involved in cell wall biosynthesis
VASRTLQTQVWGFGVPSERVLYLPNGVSLARYEELSGVFAREAEREWREKLRLEDNLVLLAYTRFAEFKPERLLRVFKRILELSKPEEAEKTRLLVVGGGFFEEEKKLREMAQPYGIADKIISTGFVEPGDLPGLLRCGDVALYPFDDTLINRARCSVKFLELLLAERPVVTEAVGQQGEYLRQGEGGYLVAPGDEEAIARTAMQLLSLSPEARREMGASGAKRLLAEFSWSKLAETVETAYSHVK